MDDPLSHSVIGASYITCVLCRDCFFNTRWGLGIGDKGTHVTRYWNIYKMYLLSVLTERRGYNFPMFANMKSYIFKCTHQYEKPHIQMGLLKKFLGVAVCGRKPGKCIWLIISFTIRRPWYEAGENTGDILTGLFWCDLIYWKYVSLRSAWYIC